MSSGASVIVFQTLCVIVLCSFVSVSWAALKEGDCEVCIKVLNKFVDSLSDDDKKSEPKIQDKFRKFCKTIRGKEERFCYYLGGSEDSATGMLNAISKPISIHKPPEKICEELKKKDADICLLKYDKTYDFKTVDFKKLKVKELKKILDMWGETNACKGCAEKSDFVKVLKDLLPKYEPEAAKYRAEKEEL